MKFHTCEKCGKIFDHKHNYIYHTTKLRTSCSNIPNKEKVIKDAHNLVKSAQNNKSSKK